jgi:hypothetical protein
MFNPKNETPSKWLRLLEVIISKRISDPAVRKRDKCKTTHTI